MKLGLANLNFSKMLEKLRKTVSERESYNCFGRLERRNTRDRIHDTSESKRHEINSVEMNRTKSNRHEGRIALGPRGWTIRHILKGQVDDGQNQ